MNSKELNELKKILLTKKEELMRIVSNKKHIELRESDVGDEVDTAGDSEERELIFGLTDNEKNMLAHIETALKKIDMGKYGVCESCSEKIAYERLKAMPFARYCMKCQPKFDKKK